MAFPLLASSNNGSDLDLAFEITRENVETFGGTDLQNVIFVLYSNHTVTEVKQSGYEVLEIPKDIHKTKMNQIIADGKEAAQIFFENRMAEAMAVTPTSNCPEMNTIDCR